MGGPSIYITHFYKCIFVYTFIFFVSFYKHILDWFACIYFLICYNYYSIDAEHIFIPCRIYLCVHVCKYVALGFVQKYTNACL